MEDEGEGRKRRTREKTGVAGDEAAIRGAL